MIANRALFDIPFDAGVEQEDDGDQRLIEAELARGMGLVPDWARGRDFPPDWVTAEEAARRQAGRGGGGLGPVGGSGGEGEGVDKCRPAGNEREDNGRLTFV